MFQVNKDWEYKYWLIICKMDNIGYLCLLTQQSNNMDMSNLDVQLEKEIWTHLQGFISTLFPFPDTKLLKNGAVGII